ncbi:helix-turn-helix domain-containing protein [Cyanobium gracile]|uniref:DNA-binding domain-containing protein, AraC-type n=1 Tax=Cyanobium gracile (strain ATCC 27147 / PCC 6307) TaxID=292564 RepID=K9P4S3_CYAGP|nr:AraC family transcriptional regulator [Cyanobium gracile]AFY27716.1 DNA-binding domain-containing protein, AraC-type [Cyanobium gracile PCC 6307]
MYSEPFFSSQWPSEAVHFSNPLLPQLQLSEDPQSCTFLLQEALPLVEIIPLEPEASWWYRGANLHLGSLVVTAWTARPMRMTFSARQEHIVVLGYGGEQRLRQASTTWPCVKGGCVLMASAACTMESTLSSAVAFALTRDRLLETAMAMGGYLQKPKGWEESVAQAHGWSPPQNPAGPSLLTALQQTIAMAGQLSGYGGGLLDRLQFDDQIYRLMVAMLLPGICQGKSLDRLLHRQSQGRDSFDELIDYIKQNLGESLTLTDLESRSHYSRRALQYSFAERMGCTATKWIKNQRLDRARQRLERPSLNDTVGSIARECGYRSLGLFSVDFQQRFHVKPSQLLRESRRL